MLCHCAPITLPFTTDTKVQLDITEVQRSTCLIYCTSCTFKRRTESGTTVKLESRTRSQITAYLLVVAQSPTPPTPNMWCEYICTSNSFATIVELSNSNMHYRLPCCCWRVALHKVAFTIYFFAKVQFDMSENYHWNRTVTGSENIEKFPFGIAILFSVHVECPHYISTHDNE